MKHQLRLHQLSTAWHSGCMAGAWCEPRPPATPHQKGFAVLQLAGSAPGDRRSSDSPCDRSGLFDQLRLCLAPCPACSPLHTHTYVSPLSVASSVGRNVPLPRTIFTLLCLHLQRRLTSEQRSKVSLPTSKVQLQSSQRGSKAKIDAKQEPISSPLLLPLLASNPLAQISLLMLLCRCTPLYPCSCSRLALSQPWTAHIWG